MIISFSPCEPTTGIGNFRDRGHQNVWRSTVSNPILSPHPKPLMPASLRPLKRLDGVAIVREIWCDGEGVLPDQALRHLAPHG